MIKRRLIHKNKKGNDIFIHQLFIWENEDLKLKLEENNLYSHRKQINTIIKNSSNNKIGYYQFKLDNTNYYKIYIIPKIVNENDPNKLIDIFNKYLLEYQRLKSKYKKRGYFEIDKHIDDFNFTLTENGIDQALVEKYIHCLNEILYFFKRHKKERVYTENFSSQSITDRLDLKNNVIELNKSNIHQKRDVIINKSILAHITKNCLDFFINKRLPLLQNEDLNKKLKSIGKSLDRLLKQRFVRNESNYTLRTFLSTKTKKHFNSNRETKRLYKNLLLLVGNKDLHNNFKIDDLVTIYFSPEYMYELVVREYFESIEAETNLVLSTFPIKNYNLKQGENIVSKIQSNPDFILKNDESIYIVDAKWKIVKSFSSIKFEDILKLDRDSKIHYENGLKQNLLLVYPSIYIPDEDYINKSFNYDYSDSPSFKIKKVEINLIH